MCNNNVQLLRRHTTRRGGCLYPHPLKMMNIWGVQLSTNYSTFAFTTATTRILSLLPLHIHCVRVCGGGGVNIDNIRVHYESIILSGTVLREFWASGWFYQFFICFFKCLQKYCFLLIHQQNNQLDWSRTFFTLWL